MINERMRPLSYYRLERSALPLEQRRTNRSKNAEKAERCVGCKNTRRARVVTSFPLCLSRSWEETRQQALKLQDDFISGRKDIDEYVHDSEISDDDDKIISEKIYEELGSTRPEGEKNDAVSTQRDLKRSSPSRKRRSVGTGDAAAGPLPARKRVAASQDSLQNLTNS